MSTEQNTTPPPAPPSGYSQTDDYFADRYQQNGLQVATIKVPVERLTSGLVAKPDPDAKSPYNRKMTVKHAEDFGVYFAKDPNAICPGLDVWIEKSAVSFERHPGVNTNLPGIEFMTMKIDKTAKMKLLDGQHRTYGLYDQREKLEKAIDKALIHLDNVRRNSPELEPTAKRELQRAKDKLRGFLDNVVEIQIWLLEGPTQAKQIFADMADNQKGMNPTQTVPFDQRKVYNRVAVDIVERAGILNDMVDLEHAALTKDSAFWTTWKDVAKAVQVIGFGPTGRWSRAKEEETNEAVLREYTNAFYEGLVKAFPTLDAVLNQRTLDPSEIRPAGKQPNLLGSQVFVRLLAAAYGILRHGSDGKPSLTHDQIVKGMATLSTEAGPKLAKEWKDTGRFREPWMAPESKQGDIKALTDLVVEKIRKAQ